MIDKREQELLKQIRFYQEKVKMLVIKIRELENIIKENRKWKKKQRKN